MDTFFSNHWKKHLLAGIIIAKHNICDVVLVRLDCFTVAGTDSSQQVKEPLMFRLRKAQINKTNNSARLDLSVK